MKPKSSTPIMDRYSLHSVGGYANDPETETAIAALEARWNALTPKNSKLAHEEAESLRTPDGFGR